MPADLSKSIPALLEDLYLDTVNPVKGYFTDTESVTTPTWAAPPAGSSVSATANQSVPGVAVGDSVVSVSFSAALPANQLYAGSHVSAVDTVTHTFTSTAAGAVTGAARTIKVVVADQT